MSTSRLTLNREYVPLLLIEMLLFLMRQLYPIFPTSETKLKQDNYQVIISHVC